MRISSKHLVVELYKKAYLNFDKKCKNLYCKTSSVLYHDKMNSQPYESYHYITEYFSANYTAIEVS